MTSSCHYVYRITNISIGMHYYGSRTCKEVLPKDDIGKLYFSSSRDRRFILDQTSNPSNYKYKVVKTFSDREKATAFEIMVHNRLDVKNHEKFYNRANQMNNEYHVKRNSPRVVIDKHIVTEFYLPYRDRTRYLSGEYMIKLDHKYELIRELGESAYLLYEFFYEKKKYKDFAPTNDESIGKILGWSTSKVTRIKSQLKKAKYLLILKDTNKDQSILYRIILEKELVLQYEKTNTLPESVEVSINNKIKKN